MLSGSETAITTLPREKIHQLDDSKKIKELKMQKMILKKQLVAFLSRITL
tara:strand:- start:122 stop:271 length:150 start_codon:yes stop_codon:yes gene_type:complete